MGPLPFAAINRWTLDQLGNWATFKEMDTDTGSNWDLDQDRSHNAVNEISGISTGDGTDWADPAHDLAGNMTTMPQPLSLGSSFTATYDAWNRLAKLQDGMTVVTTNEYDGLNQRIVRDETGGGGDNRHFYYNEHWQVLEERVESAGTIDPQPINEHVWHPYYIDALAVRYYDSNTDGSGIVRHWYLQDANFNVTAALEDDGDVLERYRYSPYGEPTVLNADFAADVDGISDIGNVYFYTGRERDPVTGLQLNRNRFYHAGLGRWLTQDPIGYDGSQWNLYQYVRSSPTVLIDPSGLLIATPVPPPTAVAPAVCNPIGAAATACVVGPVIGYQVGKRTTGPLTKWILDWCYEPCPPCPEPPRPVTDTTHDHGDCFKKTGSNTHWHFYRYHQNPDTCECFGPYRYFGGCGPVPDPG